MAQDTYIDEMTIYNPSGKAIYDAPVTTSAIIKYALMGDYYIELPFSLLTPLDFPLGSYITYKGRKFEIMSEVYPDFDNKTGGYKYTLQFQAQQNHMKNSSASGWEAIILKLYSTIRQTWHLSGRSSSPT